MANVIAGNRFLKSEVVRFLLSAGVGFLVDITVFRLLRLYILTDKSYRLPGFTVNSHSLQLTISFFSGVLVNFLITRYLVFAESKTSVGKQFSRFAAVAVAGYIASLAIINFLINKLLLNPDFARIITALSLFSLSFFIHKIFSFSLSLRKHASGRNNSQSN